MIRLWRGWKALLARKETGEAMAVFRVLIGIGALWSLAVPLGFDVWKIAWTNEGYRAVAPAPDAVLAVVLVGCGACLSLIAGLGARISALLALQCCLWAHGIHPHDGGAHDRYISNGLWLLVLADSGATWSVDAWRRTGTWSSDRRISAWPRYLAIGQIVVCYWATGIQKISPEWTPLGDFSALWYILRSPVWMRADFAWMPYWFTQLSTAATWFWEWGAPVWLYAFWCRDRRGPEHWANRYDLRTLWALWGAAMHFVLFFVAALGPLQWITVAWYAALYHPDEYRRGLSRLQTRLGRAPRGDGNSRPGGETAPAL